MCCEGLLLHQVLPKKKTDFWRTSFCPFHLSICLSCVRGCINSSPPAASPPSPPHPTHPTHPNRILVHQFLSVPSVCPVCGGASTSVSHPPTELWRTSFRGAVYWRDEVFWQLAGLGFESMYFATMYGADLCFVSVCMYYCVWQLEGWNKNQKKHANEHPPLTHTCQAQEIRRSIPANKHTQK